MVLCRSQGRSSTKKYVTTLSCPIQVLSPSDFPVHFTLSKLCASSTKKVLLFCTVLRAGSLCLHAKTAETRSNLCRVYHIFFFLQLTVPGTSPLPPASFRSRIRYRGAPERYESLRWHSEPLPLRYGTARQPNRNRSSCHTLHRWHP